ncbi:MAG TPA: FAD-dependent oxidoreductase [Pyrinomonadaceae bacterium]|nr:FAD-dependent oxidoreductase [Pyrinomonadaceae bacterium]
MTKDVAVGGTYDVAVVGAGVFGAWTAYQLQRTGKRVVLIDAYGPANSRSSSGDESRILRMGYGADEIYTRSAMRSQQLWQEFFARVDAALFHQTGVLWLAHENDAYPVRTAETFEELGIHFEKLTTDEVSARYPQIGLDGIVWAMLEVESGVLSARRAVQAVVREAIRNGVEYLQQAISGTGFPPVIYAQDARATERTLDCLVTNSGQRISAGAYVFACGPWLPKIFPDLLADRIHPTRQEVFYFGTPAGDQSFSVPALPTWIDFKDEAYGLPDTEGHGVKIAIDRHGPLFDPDSGDRIATGEGLAEARQYLARRLPALKDAPVTEARVCQYENTSNGDFLIDLHPEFENVWLVGGGSGHGFKHGPVVGKYVASRIDGSKDGIEPRFSLASKAREQMRCVY